VNESKKVMEIECCRYEDSVSSSYWKGTTEFNFNDNGTWF